MMVVFVLFSCVFFIIVDELMIDFDVIVQVCIFDLLVDIVVRCGLGLLLVMYDMGVVVWLVYYVMVMENGCFVEYCDVNMLFSVLWYLFSQCLLVVYLVLYGLEKIL